MKIRSILAACLLTAFSTQALAITIDFEGIAPGGSITTETNSTNTFNGFDVFVPHGHYVDSAAGGFASNGTDWLSHDHFGAAANQPVIITESSGAAFDLVSVDASEWIANLGLGNTLTVTGYFQGGGTIVANFVTDLVFGFETFTFSNAWSNLIQIDLIGSSSNQGNCAGFTVCGSLGYDNVVVNLTDVPEPGTLALLGIGLAGLGFAARRR